MDDEEIRKLQEVVQKYDYSTMRRLQRQRREEIESEEARLAAEDHKQMIQEDLIS